MRRLLFTVGCFVLALAIATGLLGWFQGVVEAQVARSEFVSLVPERVVDSRADGSLNVGPFDSPWGEDSTRTVNVAGVSGVPSSGVEAVVLHVTTVSPSADFSWLTMFPTGSVRPLAASVNFGRAAFTSEISNDLVVAKVDAQGRVDVYNEAGSVDLVIDVAGYFSTVGGAGFVSLEPARVLDSRDGSSGDFVTAWGAGETRSVQVGGRGGVPVSGVEAVVLHVTTVSPSADFSWLTMFPSGTERPLAASLNFGRAGFTTEISNDLVVAKVDALGRVDVYNEAGSVDLVIDVAGYFSSTGGVGFVPVDPDRVLDSRDDSSGDFVTPWGAGETRSVQVAGRGGVPVSGVEAVVLHVTTVSPSADFSWLTMFPAATERPLAASLNFGRAAFTSEISNDLVMAKVDSFGRVDVYNEAGSVHMVIDVAGYYLGPTATIEGTVTDIDSQPLDGIEVCAEPTSVAYGACADTEINGDYAIGGLPANEYLVTFTDPAKEFLGEYFDDTRDELAAQPMVVAGEQVIADIDAQLDRAAAITGTVTSEGGTPIGGIEICAFELVDSSVSCGATAADGSYVVGGLLPGEYAVRAADPASIYYTEFFDDGTYMQLSFGETLAGIDFMLTRDAAIAGFARNAAGDGVSGILVCASGPETDCRATAEDGSYQIPQLDAGSYLVEFYDNNDYRRQFYDGAESIANATLVSLEAGADATGIDAQLVRRGVLTGRVTDMSGQPIAGYPVCAIHTNNQRRCAPTDTDGVYQILRLSGDYVVEFSDGAGEGYVDVFHDNVTSRLDATQLSLSDDVVLTVDAQLARGAAITGSILSEVDGLPILESAACAFAQVGLGIGCADADEAGQFTISGLEDGVYTVSFFGTDHVLEYWDDVTNQQSATPLSLSSSGVAPRLDVQLTLGGTISGTARDDDGLPVADITTCLHAELSTECRQTDSIGAYTFKNLAAATYLLSFEDVSGTYLTQYYDGAASSTGATPLVLAESENRTGVDATLFEGGMISGTVTDPDGLAVAAASICAFNVQGSEFCATTDAQGDYAISKLAPSAYVVRFDGGVLYASEYFDDVQMAPDATSFDVEGNLAFVADAQLAIAGSLRGRVVDAAGNGLTEIQACASVQDSEEICSATDAAGDFVIGGLVDGSYLVEFRDDAGLHIGEYYDDVAASQNPFADADLVTLSGNGSVQLNDVALAEASAITGSVTGGNDPDASVLMCAALTSTPDDQDWCDWLDSGGTYRIGGLRAESYIVSFRLCDETMCTTKFFDGAASTNDATVIAVGPGQTISGIDAAFP